MATTTIPRVEYHTGSSVIHLLACSILAFCFAIRFTWKHLTVSKLCVMAIFLQSWVFVFWGGLVATGIGMSLNPKACSTGIYLCISFYGSSKVLTYIFFSDRVYIVWCANNPVHRRKSKIWMLCGVVLLGYVVIFVLMMIAKIGYIRSDGTCMIGFGEVASIPLLVYDCFLNVFLTTLFAWPILRRKLANPKLRSLAMRTCFAAAVALSISIFNVVFLLVRNGSRVGWVCLAACAFDVTANAIAICVITQAPQSTDAFDAVTMTTHRLAHPAEPTTSTLPPPPCTVDHRPAQDEMQERSSPSEPVPARKCCFISFKGLNAFGNRNEDKYTLPTHNLRRYSSRFDTQGASRPFSLSKIGNFAVTQNDTAGVITRGEITTSSDEDAKKFTVDIHCASREESMSPTIGKASSMSYLSDQCCPGTKDSSGSSSDNKLKGSEQACSHADAGRRYGKAGQKVAQVIPILRDTSTFMSTSTSEFEATGTKIEFRSPLDVMEEDQPGRESEDLGLGGATSFPHSYHHQRKWSDGNRKMSSLDMNEQHASFAITEEGDTPKHFFRGYGMTKGHR